MKNFVILVLCCGLFLSFDLPKSAIKKMDKTLSSIWPEKVVEKKVITITDIEQKKLSFKPKKNTIYNILSNERPVAYMFLSKAKSKISDFDYMVVYNSDFSILNVKVLVYREEYGGEIGSKRWLKQFEGKSDPEKMKFGHDIQNISGATISARSITFDVKKITKQIIELKKEGLI